MKRLQWCPVSIWKNRKWKKYLISIKDTYLNLIFAPLYVKHIHETSNSFESAESLPPPCRWVTRDRCQVRKLNVNGMNDPLISLYQSRLQPNTANQIRGCMGLRQVENRFLLILFPPSEIFSCLVNGNWKCKLCSNPKRNVHLANQQFFFRKPGYHFVQCLVQVIIERRLRASPNTVLY